MSEKHAASINSAVAMLCISVLAGFCIEKGHGDGWLPLVAIAAVSGLGGYQLRWLVHQVRLAKPQEHSRPLADILSELLNKLLLK